MVKHKSICTANFSGTSLGVEGSAAVEILKRSVLKNQLVYSTNVGDGDSSSSKNLFKSDPYGGIETIRKEECLGHVQKRLKKHLKKKSKSFPKLAASKVERVGQLFALVVVQNRGRSPSEIHLAHLTLLEHLIEKHDYCPFSLDSWCYFQRTPAQNAEDPLIANPSLRQPYLTAPEYSRAKETFNIFASISMCSALTMCQTQNANESLHSIIWHNSPKRNMSDKGPLLRALTSRFPHSMKEIWLLPLYLKECPLVVLIQHYSISHAGTKLEIKIERKLFWRPRKGGGNSQLAQPQLSNPENVVLRKGLSRLTYLENFVQKYCLLKIMATNLTAFVGFVNFIFVQGVGAKWIIGWVATFVRPGTL